MKVPLHVCFFGTYRANYSRNRIMLEGLRLAGARVSECHYTLWHGMEDRAAAARRGWASPRFLARLFRGYGTLVHKFRHMEDFDVMLVGYPGHLDVFLARLLTWMRRKPLGWDIFMSLYLISVERKLHRSSPLSALLLRLLERTACKLPDLLVLDTPQYADWFHQAYGVSLEKFALVPTGADDRLFRPLNRAQVPNREFTVVYHGTFIPNHGLPTIIAAADLLQDEADIHFLMIGDGPERTLCQRAAQTRGLRNIRFLDWMEPSTLAEHLAHADLLLGAFGDTPQSLMTVQNKIYEGLALARPVLTGDSEAVRHVLHHEEHVFLCPRGSPAALAESIRTLAKNPDLRNRLALEGHRLFRQCFDLGHNGQRLLSHLEKLRLAFSRSSGKLRRHSSSL